MTNLTNSFDNLLQENINQLKKLLFFQSPHNIGVAVSNDSGDFKYAGVYIITTPADDEIVYVGKTETLKGRLHDHCITDTQSDLKGMVKLKPTYSQNPKDYLVRALEINDSKTRGYFEHFVIGQLRPPWNK